VIRCAPGQLARDTRRPAFILSDLSGAFVSWRGHVALGCSKDVY